MDNTLIVIILVVLSFSLAMNLLLTMRLHAILRAELALRRPAASVQIGAPIQEFHGKALVGGRWVTSKEMRGQAAVLVFLSAGCPQCKRALPELLRVSPGARRIGLPLWIVGNESPRLLRKDLKDSELLRNVLILNPETRRRLNPQRAAPLYVFIDDDGIAKASELVGDENWSLFANQLLEASANAAA